MSTRPSRNDPAPSPTCTSLYCHTCGRIIASRKSHTNKVTPQRYCSDRCRREKPRPAPSTEADIEAAFVRLLGNGAGQKRIVGCEEVQGAVFPAKAPEGIGEAAQDGDEGGVAGAVGESGQSSDEDGGGVRLPNRMQPRTVCGVTESKIELSRRLRGMKEAKEREMVRQAARRGVAFGFKSEGKIRRTEAVQSGRVVESSFAKGDWGVRWRE